MSCLISTDDGYSRTIPYQPRMSSWVPGMEVELYHSEEKWTALYQIMNITIQKMPSAMFASKEVSIMLTRMPGPRNWDSDSQTMIIEQPTNLPQNISVKDLAKLANSIRDDMDKDIFEKITKILGYDPKTFIKKVNP